MTAIAHTDTRGAGTFPVPLSASVASRMKRTGRRDTSPELAIRRLLHARGWRYYVDRAPLEANKRRRADIVFPRRRVAVFVDGCFWHGCPEHGSLPKHNSAWWASKLRANQIRDLSTTEELTAAGWRVVRVWEHEDPAAALLRIEDALLAPLAGGRRR